MSDPAARRPSDPTKAEEEEQLAQLRELLVGPERHQLERIEERLGDESLRAADLAVVLPDAVRLRARRDDALARAAQPVVEEAVRLSVQRDPAPFAEAVAPALGPAIRRAVAHALRDFVEALNLVIDRSLSPRSLRWRWQAWRTNRPFAEVVLANVLRYRVEHVLLIHAETGLLLQHASAHDLSTDGEDMVAGMLTALKDGIQDFVRDSFGQPHEDDGDELETFTVGERTVWLERGTHAVLAAVVNGKAPPDLRRLLSDAVDGLHVQFADELASFVDDPAPLEATQPVLEECLVSELDPGAHPSSAPAWILLVSLALGLGAAAWWLSGVVREEWREHRQWVELVERLDAEPGVVVTSHRRSGDRPYIAGLRDELSRDPAELVREGGAADDVELAFEPYEARHAPWVLQRARARLAPPDGVDVALRGADVIVASGEATHDWIRRARDIAAASGTIGAYDDSAVDDLDLREHERARQAIEAAVVRVLRPHAVDPAEGQQDTLDALAKDVSSLQRTASILGRVTWVDVRGHSDATGSEDYNLQLSAERAQAVRDVLVARGVAPSALRVVAVGASEAGPESEPESLRRVTFAIRGATP